MSIRETYRLLSVGAQEVDKALCGKGELALLAADGEQLAVLHLFLELKEEGLLLPTPALHEHVGHECPAAQSSDASMMLFASKITCGFAPEDSQSFS